MGAKLKAKLCLLVIVVAGVGCSAVDKPSVAGKLSSEEQADYLKRGQEQGLKLKKTLIGELSRAMKEGGPIKAISVCKERAEVVTQKAATQGVKMGRTSARLRNPNNSGTDWTGPLLKKWDKTRLNSPVAPQVVALAEGRVGYAEPLYANALCLKCHGQKIESKVLGQIKKLYPKDQATGYHAGDLRGLLWVEFTR